MPHCLFNKTILTRLPFKANAYMASGQGNHWLMESPTCSPEICVNRVFKLIHAASSYTICR